MAIKKYSKETDFATDVVSVLEKEGFEVWKEVEINMGVADIVAEKGGEYFCFETKTSLSDDLLVQCGNRRIHFHYTFAVTPYRGATGKGYNRRDHLCRISDVKRYYIDQHKFGVWLFDMEDFGKQRWRLIDTPVSHIVDNVCSNQIIRPEKYDVQDWMVDELKKRLFDEQKLSIAGSQAGGASTAFKRSCDKIIAYLEESPGVSKKELWNNLDLHWSSYSSFTNALRTLGNVDRIQHINTLLQMSVDEQTGQMVFKT